MLQNKKRIKKVSKYGSHSDIPTTTGTFEELFNFHYSKGANSVSTSTSIAYLAIS